MIDKLELFSQQINRYYEDLALEVGRTGYRYERWLDLRLTEHPLPAFLHFRNRLTGTHKLVLIGVAKLGWTETKRIVEQVFPNLERVRISRIDLSVDFFGTSVFTLGENLYLRRAQGFIVYKKRSGTSYYLQCSPLKSVLVYDKAQFPKRVGSRRPDIDIARLEVQLKGSGIPIREFLQLWRYARLDVLPNLEVRHVRVRFDSKRPNLFIASVGFRRLIRKYGLNGALKLFPSSYRNILKATFLGPELKDELSSIKDQLRVSITNWLGDIIRFPRLRVRSKG